MSVQEAIVRFWSVTTLLDLALARPAFISWAAKTVAETAVDRLDTLRQMVEADGDRQAAIDFLTGSRWRKRAAVLKRGSAMHHAAEQLALGVTPAEVTDEVVPYVVQYQRFLDDFQPVFELAEAPVFHLEHGYAGTLDGIVLLDGQPYLLDYKSTEKGPDADSRPPYPDVALQLVAYARATHVAIRGSQQRNWQGRRYYQLAEGAELQEMPAVAGALALVVSPVDYQLVPIRIDDGIYRYFRIATQLARWELEEASRVVGAPIAPPSKAVA